MLFVWAMVILVGAVMMVLGPVLLVTKSMVLIGIVLGLLGALVLFRGLSMASTWIGRGGREKVESSKFKVTK